MTSNRKDSPPPPVSVNEKWGETHPDHFGYQTEDERLQKRGMEDWELLEKMSETSDHKVPYWFIAIFFILLFVAIGLTFPFWGVRPGYERPWFDWGIVAGAAWVIIMGGVIYYFVDYRHQRRDRKFKEKDKS